MTPTYCPLHDGYHADNCRCPMPSETARYLAVYEDGYDDETVNDPPCPTCHGTDTLSGYQDEGSGTEHATLIWREEPCPDCKLED